MFSKKIRYFRLLRNLTKKALAERAGLSPTIIADYESGKRNPKVETLKKLAAVLDVRVLDFIGHPGVSPVYSHGDFRKRAKLNAGGQELVRASVEEYFDRFFTIVSILGDSVLPQFPQIGTLVPEDDDEDNARKLRNHLGLAPSGPIPNLVEHLENHGILYCEIDAGKDTFFGINGMVNGRPYIAVNEKSTVENKRTTILHELSHMMFSWPPDRDENYEDKVSRISYAAIFPRKDALRELGPYRSDVTTDMFLICKEYGISLQLLVNRAFSCKIISRSVREKFFIRLSKLRLRNFGNLIEPEKPTLFQQLVYRAVCLDEISPSKAAELLRVPLEEVVSQCSPAEAQQ